MGFIKKTLQSPEVDRRVCIYRLRARGIRSSAYHDSTKGFLFRAAPKYKHAENKLADNHDNAKDQTEYHQDSLLKSLKP